MIYAVYGFVAGFLIPYMSRRFAKFMPATPAYALYRLVKPNKTARKVKFSTRYKQLKRKYLSRSLVYGALSALLSLLAFWRLGEEHLFWYLTFVWILLLLAEIDLKMLLLPDILTIPLLIGGFVFAAFFGVNVSAEESAAAAMAGYVLPVVATLLMLWRSVDAFGGGDIKLLSAIGAWLGLEGGDLYDFAVVSGLRAVFGRPPSAGGCVRAVAVGVGGYYSAVAVLTEKLLRGGGNGDEYC